MGKDEMLIRSNSHKLEILLLFEDVVNELDLISKVKSSSGHEIIFFIGFSLILPEIESESTGGEQW